MRDNNITSVGGGVVTVINYLQEFVGDGYKGQLSTPVDRVEVFTSIHNMYVYTYIL